MERTKTEIERMRVHMNTMKYNVLNDHKTVGEGRKTVCVSACLSYLGIKPDTYHYTSSKGNNSAYINVLRKNGYSVASRNSEFGVKYNKTNYSQLKAKIKKSNKYDHNDTFMVVVATRDSAHLILVAGDGSVLIDTAVGKKWSYLVSVKLVK